MFGRIVACVDSTATGLRAMEAGVEMASRFRCALTLVNVRSEASSDAGADLERLVPSHEGGSPLPQLVDEAVERAKKRGAAEVSVVYLRGKTVEQILRFLAKDTADLAIVGTRGLSRGSRLLLGSVSSRLVAEAPCPVLVVRPVGPSSG